MKKTISLLAGGYTGESVISLQSAAVIGRNLDKDKFSVFTILIDKDKWVYRDETGTEFPVDKNDFSLRLNETLIRFDCAFIAIHGSPGEDGKLQAYFEMLGIPHTTCDCTTSAITMNKSYTKAVVEGIKGLHTARSVQLFSHRKSEASELLSGLRYPLFIKPNNGGSSIGMSKVGNSSETGDALSKAFKEDEQVIVEEFIRGREFTVGIVRLKGEIQVLPVTEIISSKEFFDYEAKYTPGVSREITPAELGAGQVKFVSGIVKEIYLRLNCKGVVRVDFILEEHTGDFYFLEINTIPGQSENSIIPQQVRATGMAMNTFYAALIEEALRGE